VPTLPGTPPDGAAIDTAEARLDSIERDGRAYIRTPRECPDGGRWINRIRFTYADGVSQITRTANRCRREGSRLSSRRPPAAAAESEPRGGRW
jgi:hypothetical protein